MRYKSAKNECCQIFIRFHLKLLKYKKNWLQEENFIKWLICANCGRSKVPKCGAEVPKNESCPTMTKFCTKLLNTRSIGIKEKTFKLAELIGATMADQKYQN